MSFCLIISIERLVGETAVFSLLYLQICVGHRYGKLLVMTIILDDDEGFRCGKRCILMETKDHLEEGMEYLEEGKDHLEECKKCSR